MKRQRANPRKAPAMKKITGDKEDDVEDTLLRDVQDIVPEDSLQM